MFPCHMQFAYLRSNYLREKWSKAKGTAIALYTRKLGALEDCDGLDTDEQKQRNASQVKL